MAVARRAERADLVEFGWTSRAVEYAPDEPLLDVAGRFGRLGGTHTAKALREHYDGHDRVLVVTDEQAAPPYGAAVPPPVPKSVPLYTWNLAGYRPAGGETGRRRYTFGGLTDAAFRMVGLVEAGAEAAWPWTAEAAAGEG
ncbi:hypothetical protein ACFFTQ_01005 [Streptomyces roseofulvus]|uniref:hypothetical protein n=1 Tax=Streptomyces roseofulvus TaxID=33902 RepID=UPI0035E56B26